MHKVVGNTMPPPRSPERSEKIPECPPPPKKRQKLVQLRTRFWCWTLNNYDDVDIDEVKTLGQSDAIRYMVVGREKGEKGTPHLQGYTEFEKPLTMAPAKALIGEHCHLEPRRGTGKQASTYCKKDGDWTEYGVLSPVAGNRTDLDELQADLDGPSPMSDVVQKHFGAFMKYARAVTSYRSISRKAMSRNCPMITWCWGPSGTGKSRSLSAWLTSGARNLSVSDCYFVSTTPTGTWWDGYDGQKVCVLDDFREVYFKHEFALRLFDSIPLKVPAHGAQLDFISEFFYISSNEHPLSTYKNDPKQAFERRMRDFAEVWYCDHDVWTREWSPRVNQKGF